MQRMSDLLLMFVAGLVTIVFILGVLGAAMQFAGPPYSRIGTEQTWIVAGVVGYLFGLSWRFIFWDLPGMAWHFVRYHRHNLHYMALLAFCVGLLFFL